MIRYLIVLVALLGSVVAALLINSLLDFRAGKAFARIELGLTEARVIAYMGGPSQTEQCGEQLWWNDKALGSNDGRCVKWARYNYRHSNWGIGYSADNHVVSKHHYDSE